MSNLHDAISQLLVKRGKVANHYAGGGLEMPDAYRVEDAGQGPYIGYWGADLGPMPTLKDGFTEHQIGEKAKVVERAAADAERAVIIEAEREAARVAAKEAERLEQEKEQLERDERHAAMLATQKAAREIAKAEEDDIFAQAAKGS